MEIRIFEALLETMSDRMLDLHRGRISISVTGDKDVSIECEGIGDDLTLPLEMEIPDIILSLEAEDIALWIDFSRGQAEEVVSWMLDALISLEENSPRTEELSDMKEKLLEALRQINQSVQEE